MKSYLTGSHGVAEALKRGRGVLYIARDGGRAAALARLAADHGVPVRRTDERSLARMVNSDDLRGYALETDGAPESSRIRTLDDLWPRLGDAALAVVLDGVTDPRNLGAVLRAADQFAADVVLIPRRRSAHRDADSVSRTSAGAVEWVPLIEVANIPRILGELKDHGFWIWGADLEGQPAPEASLGGRTAVVLGREGEGLHRLVREGCDGTVRIPTGGKLDSLNVATASGVLMYEVRRQQGFPY